MSFHFTEAQWEGVGRCIERVGGIPTNCVKGEIEGYINSVFTRNNFDEQKTILFRRVFVAATDLSDALRQLAEIGKLEAEADEIFGDEIMYSDLKQRLRFAKVSNNTRMARIGCSTKDFDRLTGLHEGDLSTPICLHLLDKYSNFVGVSNGF